MSQNSRQKNKTEDASMTHGFQQQDPGVGFCIPKSAATPQHGQKPDKKGVAAKPPRTVQPRPGH